MTPPPHPSHDLLLILFAATLSFLFHFKASSPPPPPPPPSCRRCRRCRCNMTAMNNYSSTESLSFSSAESLSSFLKPLVPLSSSWGSLPGSKTVHNLFLELSRQETLLLLLDPPSLLRTVNVATLTITNPRRPSSVLLESHQIMSDGSVRRRMRPLSEKMTPGESIEAAAERAVREELGPDVRVRVDMGTYEVRVDEKRSSVSYPGLPARYVLHSVKAVVEEGVPEEGEFSTEEGGEGHGEDDDGTVYVKRHFWKWVDQDYDDSSAGAAGAGGSGS